MPLTVVQVITIASAAASRCDEFGEVFAEMFPTVTFPLLGAVAVFGGASAFSGVLRSAVSSTCCVLLNVMLNEFVIV